MLKFIFLDTETTGLDPNLNAIIEVGATIDAFHSDGSWKEVERFCFKMRPHAGAVIEPSALEVHGYTTSDIDGFQLPKIALDIFQGVLSEYVNKYNKRDKFFFVGFNAGFDFNFVHQWFEKAGEKYCGSWFLAPPIDVAALAAMYLLNKRASLPNFRLETVGRYFGVVDDNTKFHSALDDILVTKAIFKIVAAPYINMLAQAAA